MQQPQPHLSTKSIQSCVTYDAPKGDESYCWEEFSVYPPLSPDDDFFNFKPKPVSQMKYQKSGQK